jgi:1,4-alpha-glucan branching enzyme
MAKGYLALVLHTHLPFVRHPEHDRPLEERWLYEALCECYLPLIDMFRRLEAQRIPFALTMSLTPPLAAMLNDELLRERFGDYLSRLESLVIHERKRLVNDGHFEPIAVFYQHRFQMIRETWEAINHDVVGALRKYYDQGSLDLITCSATHAYLPGLLSHPESIRAQLQLGVRAFEMMVGRTPKGMWLPECAYDPAFDQEIADAGVRYTLLDTHGLNHAQPRPPFGVHHPVISPSGTAFFARDEESSRQVWSRQTGFPGNPYYRDFYRDIGFDLEEKELHGEIGPFGVRIMTGLKYYRITGNSEHKLPYQPGIAKERAFADAGLFLGYREAQIHKLAEKMPVPPVVVAPYDSELFGHWWFEGPLFLEGLFRHAAAAYADHETVELITLRDYLQRHPAALQATPSASSWGAGGYGDVWVGPAAAKFWRHIHHSSQYLYHLVSTRRFETGIRGKALDQAIIQLLLLQTSDWPFILKTGSVTEYAESRIRVHAARIRRLGTIVEGDSISESDVHWMNDLATRDNFLANMPSEVLRSALAGA